MANYYWDLGFDFNAVAQSGGTFYLQNGFVLMQGPGNPTLGNVPGTPVELQKDDTISFNAFNVTDPLTGSYSVLGGSITFQSALTTQTNSSPFDGSIPNPMPFLPQPTPNNFGYSVILSGIQAPNAKNPTNPAKFPVYYGPSGLQVKYNGHFLISVSLNVQQTLSGGQTITKVFAVDPEMVVGGAGAG